MSLYFQKCSKFNLLTLWNNEVINPNAEEEKVKWKQFIENPKITSGWQAVQQNQFIKTDYIQLSAEFQALIPVNLRGSLNPNRGVKYSQIKIQQSQIIDQIPSGQIEVPSTIIDDAKTQIETITKRVLFQETVSNIQFLLNLYDYYETWNKLNGQQATIQTIWSVMNGSLQIVSLIYLSNEVDMFISALRVLIIVNPILQMLSLVVFQYRLFKVFSTLRQLFYILLLQYLTFKDLGYHYDLFIFQCKGILQCCMMVNIKMEKKVGKWNTCNCSLKTDGGKKQCNKKYKYNGGGLYDDEDMKLRLGSGLS